MVAADESHEVVCLPKPSRDRVVNLLIVSGFMESKPAVSGDDKERVGAGVLDA